VLSTKVIKIQSFNSKIIVRIERYLKERGVLHIF
jgi:hypothetical protein